MTDNDLNEHKMVPRIELCRNIQGVRLEIQNFGPLSVKSGFKSFGDV